MQTDISMGLEVLTTVFLPFILGFAAALARLAKNGNHGLVSFISDAIICCFFSVIVFWGLDMHPDLAPTVKAAITGLSSFFCKDVLDVLKKRVNYEIWNRWRIKEGDAPHYGRRATDNIEDNIDEMEGQSHESDHGQK